MLFRNKEFVFVVVILTLSSEGVTAKTCKVLNDYRMDISDQLCRPCSRSSKLDPVIQSINVGICPNATNVTQVFLTQLVNNMGTVAHYLRLGRDKLTTELNAENNFQPMKIPDLQSVNSSPISSHLRRSNKPEEIIHSVFARVVLLSAHLDLAQCILSDLNTLTKEPRRELIKTLQQLDHRVKPTLCQLYDFTLTLGVSKIKKKVCRYAKRIKGLDSNRDETNFIVTVLMDGVKYAEESVKDLNDLPSHIEKCKYKRCDGNNMKLVCEGEKSNGKSRKTRHDKKDRRSRKKGGRRGKNRKDKRNRRCKNEDSSKQHTKRGKKCKRHRKAPKHNL